MYFRLWASASSDEALPVVIIELPLLLPPYSRLFAISEIIHCAAPRRYILARRRAAIRRHHLFAQRPIFKIAKGGALAIGPKLAQTV